MIQISSFDRSMICQWVFRGYTEHKLVVNKYMAVQLVDVIHFHIDESQIQFIFQNQIAGTYRTIFLQGYKSIWIFGTVSINESRKEKTAEHRRNADVDRILLNPAAVQFKLHIFAVLQNVVSFLIKQCAVFRQGEPVVESCKKCDAKFSSPVPG